MDRTTLIVRAAFAKLADALESYHPSHEPMSTFNLMGEVRSVDFEYLNSQTNEALCEIAGHDFDSHDGLCRHCEAEQ